MKKNGSWLFIKKVSATAGIWSRDIRFKSNLPLTEINKILKNLESKKLIKAVKSVAVSEHRTTETIISGSLISRRPSEPDQNLCWF